MNSAGIYMIKNKVNDKVYIGSSKNMNTRMNQHFATLRNQTHHNKHLQKSYNKYGEDAFEFIILENVGKSKNIREKELYYINKYDACNRNLGYNISKNTIHPSNHTVVGVGKIGIRNELEKLSDNAVCALFKLSLFTDENYNIVMYKGNIANMSDIFNILKWGKSKTYETISELVKHNMIKKEYDSIFINPIFIEGKSNSISNETFELFM